MEEEQEQEEYQPAKQRPVPQKPINPDRYQAYHIPEEAGIMDYETKTEVKELLPILAMILNKVTKIEQAVC